MSSVPDGLAANQPLAAITGWPYVKAAQTGDDDAMTPGDTLGPGRGLPQQPLRHRCLRDAERGGQIPLRHAALPAGALECLPEPPALLGSCHVTASGSVIRADATSMPDRPTVDRLSLFLRSQL